MFLNIYSMVFLFRRTIHQCFVVGLREQLNKVFLFCLQLFIFFLLICVEFPFFRVPGEGYFFVKSSVSCFLCVLLSLVLLRKSFIYLVPLKSRITEIIAVFWGEI